MGVTGPRVRREERRVGEEVEGFGGVEVAGGS